MTLDAATRTKITAMNRKELTDFYNSFQSPTTQIKSFRTVGAGRDRVLKLLEDRLAAAAPAQTVSTDTEPKGKGRPIIVFSVKLSSNPRTSIQSRSLRGQVLAFCKERIASGPISSLQLEAHFGKRVRGALNKMFEAHHLLKVTE